MKISIKKEEFIEILNSHYKKSGMEIESIEIDEMTSVVLKELKTDDVYEKRRQDFLKIYYEKFGSDAPYPFKEKDQNDKQVFSLNFYGVKSNLF